MSQYQTMIFNNIFHITSSTQALGSWVTLATPIIALLALILACLQLKSSRKTAKENNALTAYDSYLTLCLTYPTFAYAKKAEIIAKNEEYKKYKWFLTKVLFTFEQIIEALPNDEKWKTAISAQLSRHRWHLKKSSMIQRKEWDPRLLKIIDDIISKK